MESKLSSRQTDLIEPHRPEPAAQSRDSFGRLTLSEGVELVLAGGELASVPVKAEDVGALDIELQFGRFDSEVSCLYPVENSFEQFGKIGKGVSSEIDIVSYLYEVP